MTYYNVVLSYEVFDRQDEKDVYVGKYDCLCQAEEVVKILKQEWDADCYIGINHKIEKY
jgi:hypothetical protein